MSELAKFTSQLDLINDGNFDDIALELFRYQYKNNLLYQTYARYLGKEPDKVFSVKEIPFLPIRFFKTHAVISGNWNPEIIFTSSATTGSVISQHAVKDAKFYTQNARTIFQRFYGTLEQYHFIALLPSYLERSGSSLIYMIDHFIKSDSSGHSGFYLHNQEELLQKVESLKKSDKKTILWGVSFALLDLAEKYEVDLSHCLVFETGGMKGRRKEWIREELYKFLKARFKVPTIHSEYGMTELLSQAYAKADGYFQSPPWMKILVRDINDPFQMINAGKTGGINVIDLANAHSCAFIETEDLGRVVYPDFFEILGRMDNSDIRGCNLLVS